MVNKKFVLLLYHGVTKIRNTGIRNCSHKHIFIDDFTQQMELLARDYKVLRLSELLDLKRKGSLPERAIVITFDDGFENNYSVAFPILRRYNMPATFFLTTGFINSNSVFWVDKIEYLLNESPLETLHLDVLDRQYSLRTLSGRKYALQNIKLQLKTMPALIEETIKKLEKVSGCQPKYDYEDYKTMTWEQVRQMRSSGLCEFGAHTLDHAILSYLSKEDKEYQITQSKRVLEKEIGEDINLFSYPEGLENHFDDETIEILRSQGFICSATAIFGVNTQLTSDYHLYRNMVEFEAPFKECVEILDVSCS